MYLLWLGDYNKKQVYRQLMASFRAYLTSILKALGLKSADEVGYQKKFQTKILLILEI